MRQLIFTLIVYQSFMAPHAVGAKKPARNCKLPLRVLSNPSARNVGKLLLARQESVLDALYPTTGFKTRDDYQKALKTAPYRRLPAIVQQLQDENLEVVIHRNESKRDDIARDGILNQHQTKGSGGYKGTDARDVVEASYLNMPIEQYRKLDPKVKAKYALVRPTPESKQKPVLALNYGKDVYVLKKDRIRKRMTWTPGDSIDRAEQSGKVSLDAKARTIQAKAGGFKPVSWDQLFIPWSDRNLLVPFLLKEKDEMGSEGDMVDGQSPLEVDEASGMAIQSSSKSGTERFKTSWYTHPNYIEAQIWGPIDLDDVEYFEFHGEPPSGKFLSELLRHGVKIRDGRKWPPVLWQPPPVGH